MSHAAQGLKGEKKAPSISFAASLKGTNPERLIAVTPRKGGTAPFAPFL